MESESWKSVGKIFASIALSALIAFFWISNFEKSKIQEYKNQGDEKQASILIDHLKKPFNLVSFWATWCENCAQSLKDFDQIAPELGPDFYFLSINMDKDQVDAQGFWNQLDIINTALIFDDQERYQKSMNVEVLPTYFLIDKTGNLLLRLEGNIQWDDPKVITLLKNTSNSFSDESLDETTDAIQVPLETDSDLKIK